MNYRILIVDDDQDNLNVNKKLLTANGYLVYTATTGEEALDLVKSSKIDFALILMDYHMPGKSGTETIIEIKKFKPNQQILAFSLDFTREVMRENFKAGAVDYLDKNTENENLLNTIESYCAKYDDLYRSINKADLNIDERTKFINEIGMIGCSSKLYDLAKQIKKFAPTQATTLILGESGTGKELVARALHEQSERSRGPFIAINIAAEPSTLLDSILFGHKKGAFTGSTSDQPGKFLQASGGTIFLDEIGDMGIDLQVKLLRVLQEKEVTPIGGTRPLNIDVRIVAATHKDLKKMVSEGTFREDLYYRLSNVVLQTHPLRERIEDIESLVSFFTEEICKENGFTKHFQRKCLEVFRNYPWNGNVRELRSIIERHLIKNETGSVKVEDLDQELFKSEISTNFKIDSKIKAHTLDELDVHLEEVKKNWFLEVLNRSNSKAEAARTLGIPRNRLFYFITKWGIDKENVSSYVSEVRNP